MDTQTIRSDDLDHQVKTFKEKKLYPDISRDNNVKEIEKDVENKVETDEPENEVIEEDEKSSEERRTPVGDGYNNTYQKPNNNENEDIPIIIPQTVPTSQRSTKCCSSFEESLKGCKPLHWYLAPATFDIGSSISCFFYHWLNFALELGLWIFLVTAISTFVPFIILACVGVPLLYLTFEITLFIGRIQFYMNYYMVERDPLLLGPEKWRLRLTLDNKNLPKCGTICQEGVRLNRIKFIFTSLNMYGILLYDLILNPIVILFTALSVAPVMYCVYFIAYPFWYAGDKSYFHNGNACVFDCQVWKLNSVEDVILIFFIGLLLLPLSFRLCNYMAYLSKCVCYWVLTDYYKNGNNNENIGRNLLNTSSSSVSNHGSINDRTDVIIKTNNEDGVVSTELKDINDGGNTNEQKTTQKSLYDQL